MYGDQLVFFIYLSIYLSIYLDIYLPRQQM